MILKYSFVLFVFVECVVIFYSPYILPPKLTYQQNFPPLLTFVITAHKSVSAVSREPGGVTQPEAVPSPLQQTGTRQRRVTWTRRRLLVV